MSRNINLRLSEADVRTHCVAAGISISTIEPLPAGGTHLVCVTGEGADEIRLRFQNHRIPASCGDFRSTALEGLGEALARSTIRKRP
jgi:hypothetical protein